MEYSFDSLFNFLFSNGRTEQKEACKTMQQFMLPKNKNVRKVQIFHFLFSGWVGLKGLRFYDGRGDLMLEVGQFEYEMKEVTL